MGTDKPLVSILMAVYEPNMAWFKEQLRSLDAQTYPNLRLYIRDDCSSTVSFSEIHSCVQDCISSFPIYFARNEQNMGSTKTFEQLTKEAEGEYFAYCDQDDIWRENKIEVSVATAIQMDALLVCSDMQVIDGFGTLVADSITELRKRHIFFTGNNLSQKLLFHNFVTGCTMLVDSKSAKESLPFCPHMVHDHYLALWCAEHGRIESILNPLIYYRIHSKNQTGFLAGVSDKQSYRRIRIENLRLRFEWLKSNFDCSAGLKISIEHCIEWTDARINNWDYGTEKQIVWKYRKFSKITAVFELATARMPDGLFRWLIYFLKHKNL